VDKETQARIIEEVRRISYHVNPRVWIGIKWLSTYVAIRPVELLNVKEGDFDLGLGVVNVKHNKEDKPKIVPLLPEDIDLIRSPPDPTCISPSWAKAGAREVRSILLGIQGCRTRGPGVDPRRDQTFHGQALGILDL
jgi:integrase